MTEENKLDFILPGEFLDVFKVLDFGAKKYTPNGWLEPDAYKMDHKSNHDSMFHHLAESLHQDFGGLNSRKDLESKLDPLLHLACRALMQYTRMKRGIKNEKD